MSTDPAFVAITPAHNEADRIGALVESMAAQDTRPCRWIIVDDASDDDTADVAERVIADVGLDNVTVARRTRPVGRSFSSKADAVNHGWKALAAEGPVTASYVACIDSDVILPSEFFSVVAREFAADDKLGVTGGVYVHPVRGELVVDNPPPDHVPGPTQTFRRETWEAIGGYWQLPNGGIDTAANVAARMEGWATRCLPDLVVDHSRRMGTGGGRHPVVAEYFKGRQDHDLGAHPIFELGKVAKRVTAPPVLIGSLARLVGYLHAVVRRDRPVSKDFTAFVRAEQLARVRRGGRVDRQ